MKTPAAAANASAPCSRRAWLMAAAAALLVAAGEATRLFRWYLDQARLPLWDMAQNGWRAVELAADLEQGRLLAFLLDLNRHDTWPFGYSLLLLPALLLLGPGFAAATLPQAVCFALVPPGLVAAAYRMERGVAGLLGGLLAAALFVASPLARLFAILIMRELAGCLFLVVATILYLRAVERATLGAWRLAGGAGLFLFFIKYNYGLAWLSAAVLFEIGRRNQQQRRELLAWAHHWLWPWRDASRWRRGLAGTIYAVALALAGAAAGGASIGGAVYGLIVLATLALALAPRRLGRPLLRWARSREPALRAALETLVAPLWLWSLSPRPIHPRGVLEFLRNRDSELPLAADLAFYPAALAEHLVAHPAWAVLIVVGLLLALLRWRRAGPGWRFVCVLAVVGAAGALLHPYKQPRFLLTSAPPLFLLAGCGLAAALSAATRRPLRVSGIVIGGLAGAAILALPPLGERSYVARSYPAYSADPALTAVLDAVGELAPRQGRIAILGSADELSPALLAWTVHCHRRGAATVVAPMARPPAGSSRLQIRARRDRWLARQQADTVLVIRTTRRAPWFASEDFIRFNRWQLLAMDGLEKAGWRLTGRRQLPALGVRVLRWSPAPSPATELTGSASRRTARSPAGGSPGEPARKPR